MAVGGRWIPWHALKARPHLVLRWAAVSPGRGRIEDVGGGRRLITIDPSLDQRNRAATLGHEIVHDELDMLWPPGTPPALVEKGEQKVDRITTKRFVPPAELVELIRQKVSMDTGVTVADVCEEFEVAECVARRALYLFSIEPVTEEPR